MTLNRIDIELNDYIASFYGTLNETSQKYDITIFPDATNSSLVDSLLNLKESGNTVRFEDSQSEGEAHVISATETEELFINTLVLELQVVNRYRTISK